MPKLKIGAKAPDFELPDKQGKLVQLSKIKAAAYVVYFYPRDNTPGCTVEAIGFSKLLPRFKRKKIAVIGISGGDEKSKQLFCKKHGLSVPLLSDHDFSVCKAYGVYGTKSFMGRKFKGVKRITFVLDHTRKLKMIYSNVKPALHAEEILGDITAMFR